MEPLRSIMGPGVPHSVISLQQPGYRPVSTVMTGSHCLNRFSMAPTLYTSIKHAFWHDVWTNATHDDRDFAVARMLLWQAMRMEADAEHPFKGENLYSLLVMGLVPFVLQSLPFHAYAAAEGNAKDGGTTAKQWLERYDPMEDSEHSSRPSDMFLTAVRHHMVKLSRLILFQLGPEDMKQFQRFWVTARGLFVDEYERRCQYTRS